MMLFRDYSFQLKIVQIYDISDSVIGNTILLILYYFKVVS